MIGRAREATRIAGWVALDSMAVGGAGIPDRQLLVLRGDLEKAPHSGNAFEFVFTLVAKDEI